MDKNERFSVALKIAQTSNKINQSLSSKLKIFDIAPEQRAILYFVERYGEINQNELTAILAKDKTTVSRTLDAIEKKGYISRNWCKDDKRVKLISLTNEGRRVLDATTPTIQEFRSAVLEGFTDKEVEEIFQLIEKVSKNIDRYNSGK